VQQRVGRCCQLAISTCACRAARLFAECRRLFRVARRQPRRRQRERHASHVVIGSSEKAFELRNCLARATECSQRAAEIEARPAMRRIIRQGLREMRHGFVESPLARE
jgi:transposase-like protein